MRGSTYSGGRSTSMEPRRFQAAFVGLIALSAVTAAGGCRDAIGDDADADDDSDAATDAATVGGSGGPCAPALPVVDGKLGGEKIDPADPRAPCPEYTASIPGLYTTVHLRMDNKAGTGRLQVLNDWRLRADMPICPVMYNEFNFITGNGSAWQVRVYGEDGRVDVRRDGAKYKGKIEAMDGFGASPDASTPHTLFEFAVEGPLFGTIILTEKDPSGGTWRQTGRASWQPGDPIEGCDDPHNANVAEPTIFVAELGQDGVKGASTATGPLLAWVDPPAIVGGQSVLLSGQGFGAAGEVRATVDGGTTVVWPTQSWSDKAIALTPPPLPFGSVAELTVAPAGGGNVSNALKLRWLQPGAPEDCATAPPGAPCDDKDAATFGDACTKTSTCQGTKVECPDLGPCLVETYNKDLGACESKLAVATPCDDGDSCTADDTCVGGACSGDRAAATKACDDGKPCTADLCDKAKGCQHPAAALGTPCDDGDACTEGDGCGASGCKPGAAVVCDDGNVCTSQTCVAGKGCVAAPADGPCNADDSVCTPGDTCQGGTCKAGPAKTCVAGGPCVTASCNPATGDCTSTPKVGSSCDDGEFCTFGDACTLEATCVGSAFAPGDPKSSSLCEDGKPCTIDTCEKGKGCVFVKDPSPACQ